MEPPMEPSGGEQEPGAVRLLDLPWEDVLLPHVLNWVPLRQLLRLQRVSRAFRALVQLHLARLRRFDAAQVGPQIPRAALARLLRDAEGLQELALDPCHEWLSDDDLVPVLARNPQLRSVALACCGQLSRRALGALAEGCPRLQRLSLAHCDWVDGLALRGLADRCPALEELDLTACRQLKDEAIVYLAQRRGPSLRSLSLAVNANVGDTAVQELARNCPKLEHLDLTGCLRVGSDADFGRVLPVAAVTASAALPPCGRAQPEPLAEAWCGHRRGTAPAPGPGATPGHGRLRTLCQPAGLTDCPSGAQLDCVVGA
ncbi:F-box/LRR-repeat protein 15 isoform X1 [Meriones unguiculatus]|uniref:F-box/LRR-repeat protein 15 isoform X1 n=1 Tax=Meriones unguiculatus TaxID=10047 RepID=UPI00293F5CE4|nr:F-box/LRR-repeat protein 15 isoform X1 [Meriones unguiculatus]XP_060246614.1 F-box/LRR-repeat protein 15 isoform X1 [Meriones unguiculatus]XP_060246615.1 F-box/LRR-repeat protein 15 isoform X1 [Meriones unguiculatus]